MADTLVEGTTLTNTPLGGSAVPTPDWTLTGFAGPASWGIPGQLYPVSTEAQLFDAVGAGALNSSGATPPGDLVREVLDFLDTAGMDGSSLPMNALVTRLTDGTDTAAVMLINDVAAGLLVTLTARSTGSRANGATWQLTPSFNSTTSKPTFDLTITMPYGTPQTWVGIIGWSGGSPAFSAPTVAANIVAAINNGFGQTGPSLYFVATLSGTIGTAQPVVNTVTSPTTLGTDGATTVTTAEAVGSDTISARTGAQVFKGSGVFQFCIAGMIDATADAALATLAQGERSVALSAVPSGTTTAAAIASFIPVPSIYLGKVIDWLFVDSSGVKHCPLGTILGIMAQTPPWVSISNKPRQGLTNVLSTEKSSKSLSNPEMGQRQGAGLLYITNNMPRKGRLWGLAHGRNTSGIQYQDDFQYTRTVNYYEQILQNVCGPLVGENQGPDPDDDLRRNASSAVKSRLTSEKLQRHIVDYDVTDDLTNNTAQTIAQGYNFMAVEIETFVGVREFFVGLTAGGNIVVTSQPAA